MTKEEIVALTDELLNLAEMKTPSLRQCGKIRTQLTTTLHEPHSGRKMLHKPQLNKDTLTATEGSSNAKIRSAILIKISTSDIRVKIDKSD